MHHSIIYTCINLKIKDLLMINILKIVDFGLLGILENKYLEKNP